VPPYASSDGGFLIARPQRQSHGASFLCCNFITTIRHGGFNQSRAFNTLYFSTQNVAGQLEDLLLVHCFVVNKVILAVMGTVSSPLVPVNQVSHIIQFVMANFTFIKHAIFVIFFLLEV